jgi:alkylated DNA repair dioxygenase AlkB
MPQTAQLDFFSAPPAGPPGFRYQADLIAPETEEALLAAIPLLPFKEFEFHGHVGKRRTISFGWGYDFSREALRAAPEIPPFLVSLRSTAAIFAGVEPQGLVQVLVTEYGAGAGIGWHRDKAVFGDVIGISLLAPCQFRLRRRAGNKWERVTVEAAPRSAYLLSGPARTEWEHSIPPVDRPRYSVTYRSLRNASKVERTDPSALV